MNLKSQHQTVRSFYNHGWVCIFKKGHIFRALQLWDSDAWIQELFVCDFSCSGVRDEAFRVWSLEWVGDGESN